MFVHQTIDRPCGVNVFGSCLIRVEPDTASLKFSVSQLDEKPEGAFRKTREAVGKVRVFLSGEGVPERDVGTSRIVLEQAYRGYGKEMEFLGYRANVSFNVTTGNLEAVEGLLAGAVAAGANQIESVTFHTKKLKELRAEARRRAVQAARIKAENYCGAAGVALGKVIHIEDVDPDEMRGRRGHGADLDLSEHDETCEPAAAYNPGSLVVEAAVMVGFALLPA
jgi:uncharacterized protein YggE